jgi:hypothetical protein
MQCPFNFVSNARESLDGGTLPLPQQPTVAGNLHSPLRPTCTEKQCVSGMKETPSTASPCDEKQPVCWIKEVTLRCARDSLQERLCLREIRYILVYLVHTARASTCPTQDTDACTSLYCCRSKEAHEYTSLALQDPFTFGGERCTSRACTSLVLQEHVDVRRRLSLLEERGTCLYLACTAGARCCRAAPFTFGGERHMPVPHLYCRSMLLSGGRPTSARMKFSRQARCLERALITGVPSGTRGAFAR